MEFDDFNDRGVVYALVTLVLVCFLLGFFTYREYEPTIASGTEQGTVISYHAGGGKAAARPYFKVKLATGLIVHVVDNREIPYSYRGPVILKKMKRKDTIGYIYLINSDVTKTKDKGSTK